LNEIGEGGDVDDTHEFSSRAFLTMVSFCLSQALMVDAQLRLWFFFPKVNYFEDGGWIPTQTLDCALLHHANLATLPSC
jgi:hypothetical protein